MTHPKTSELMARLRFRAQVLEAQARRAIEASLSRRRENSTDNQTGRRRPNLPPAAPAWFNPSKVKPFTPPVDIGSVSIEEAAYGLEARSRKRTSDNRKDKRNEQE